MEFSCIPHGGAPSLESLVVMDVEQYSEFLGLSGILLSIRKCAENFRELSLSAVTSLRMNYKLSAIDAWCLLTKAN